jgi:hypothetical protein
MLRFAPAAVAPVPAVSPASAGQGGRGSRGVCLGLACGHAKAHPGSGTSPGTHTAQALEHAEAAAKESSLAGIQEHARVSLTHVQAAEQAKEEGAEHLTAAKTALNDALRAKDPDSAKKAAETAEGHLEMIE